MPIRNCMVCLDRICHSGIGDLQISRLAEENDSEASSDCDMYDQSHKEKNRPFIQPENDAGKSLYLIGINVIQLNCFGFPQNVFSRVPKQNPQTLRNLTQVSFWP